METLNSALPFAYWLLCCIAENFLPEARPMISMLGPTRVSDSSDIGLHDNLHFNVTGSYPPSQVIARVQAARAIIARLVDSTWRCLLGGTSRGTVTKARRRPQWNKTSTVARPLAGNVIET